MFFFFLVSGFYVFLYFLMWVLKTACRFLLLFWVGWSKSRGSYSTWSTLKRKLWLVSGMRLRSTSLDLPKSMIIDTPWRFSSRLESKSILKLLTGTLIYSFFFGMCVCLFVYYIMLCYVFFWVFLFVCLYWQLNYKNVFRNDRAKAVEILVKDLKVFSTFNEELFKEITQLLTLENFRYLNNFRSCIIKGRFHGF